MKHGITKLLIFVSTLVVSFGLFALLYLFFGLPAFDAGILPAACIVFSAVTISLPSELDD